MAVAAPIGPTCGVALMTEPVRGSVGLCGVPMDAKRSPRADVLPVTLPPAVLAPLPKWAWWPLAWSAGR